jgi:hypothetical protein
MFIGQVHEPLEDLHMYENDNVTEYMSQEMNHIAHIQKNREDISNKSSIQESLNLEQQEAGHLEGGESGLFLSNKGSNLHKNLDKKLLKTRRQDLKENRAEIQRLKEILTEDRLKGYNK